MNATVELLITFGYFHFSYLGNIWTITKIRSKTKNKEKEKEKEKENNNTITMNVVLRSWERA